MATLSNSTLHSTAPKNGFEPAKPILYILLDILGVLMIFLGLAQQFGKGNVLPDVMNIHYSGLIMMSLGLALTLPFFAWTVKTCSKILNNISI
ncbi:MAG: hypothetical protein NWQ54_08350 [Paraglaciecola sp.]|uniref:hypothetical protein n=1 Tax=Pseudomonadati TaxID=3379134 RepID=UPI00273DFB6B|nr:hypothetical protein [Paraglaciecola sp.]MDP5030036.1 hypothetical protein [Paraglaciecola sp.]MDP5130882.1 hypothetical protein [Paraglaciecola sp.]